MADVDADELFDLLGLTEYERVALAELLRLGRTTAPNLSDATDIPKARIYGVLDELADRGYVKVIPGRPKQYQPKSPGDIVDRAEENRRQEFEGFRRELTALGDAFVTAYTPRFERAGEDITPTEELFWVVDVGEPSESETRRLYREAEHEVRVITKSFEYLDAVAPALGDALDRGIDASALFLHSDLLSSANRQVQSERVQRIEREYSELAVRFSTERLPWRGTLVDPSMDYETGEAIFLVEEPDVPLHMRQAAITDNASFVAGLNTYFELIWAHQSTADPTEALE